jgi:hypothetical protein
MKNKRKRRTVLGRLRPKALGARPDPVAKSLGLTRAGGVVRAWPRGGHRALSASRGTRTDGDSAVRTAQQR